MHMAADLSCRLGWVERELVDRSVALMQKAGLPVELPKGGGMDMDKFLNVRNVFSFFVCFAFPICSLIMMPLGCKSKLLTAPRNAILRCFVWLTLCTLVVIKMRTHEMYNDVVFVCRKQQCHRIDLVDELTFPPPPTSNACFLFSDFTYGGRVGETWSKRIDIWTGRLGGGICLAVKSVVWCWLHLSFAECAASLWCGTFDVADAIAGQPVMYVALPHKTSVCAFDMFPRLAAELLLNKRVYLWSQFGTLGVNITIVAA